MRAVSTSRKRAPPVAATYDGPVDGAAIQRMLLKITSSTDPVSERTLLKIRSCARTVTIALRRALNAAARVITGTRKFDGGLGQTLHDQLHWLDVPDRVLFKLAAWSRAADSCCPRPSLDSDV